MLFRELRLFILVALFAAILGVSRGALFLSDNLTELVRDYSQAILNLGTGSSNKAETVGDGVVAMNPVANPVEPVIDVRQDQNETYMFRYDYAGGSIAIGKKSSGLPGYRITDDLGRFVEIEVDPASLYGMSDKEATVRSRKNLVWFIYDNFTVRFQAEAGRVKTDYILNDKPTRNILKFKIYNSPGYDWVKNVPGSPAVYELTNGKGELSWAMLEPLNGEDSGGRKLENAEIYLDNPGGKIILDKKFLADAAYPVIIDPTIATGVGSRSPLSYPNGRKLFKDSKGNFLALWTHSENASNNITASYSNDGGATWTNNIFNGNTSNIYNYGLNAALDSSNRLHFVWSATVKYSLASPSYGGDSTIDSITFGSTITLQAAPANVTPREPSVIIMHDGFPGVAWVKETGGGVKDSSVYFERCASGISGGTLGCDDAVTKWINAAGTASDSPDQIFTTGANSTLSVTLAQVPTGAGTQEKALAVFFSQGGSTALRRVIATCNNCGTTPPTWNAWGTTVTLDSSTVSATIEFRELP